MTIAIIVATTMALATTTGTPFIRYVEMAASANSHPFGLRNWKRIAWPSRIGLAIWPPSTSPLAAIWYANQTRYPVPATFRARSLPGIAARTAAIPSAAAAASMPIPTEVPRM